MKNLFITIILLSISVFLDAQSKYMSRLQKEAEKNRIEFDSTHCVDVYGGNYYNDIS